ncbi:MAG: ANTAR domain-containing protein [Ruminiclostridium sp.]|nr:ANTAR domain-containing protein [Ruminiclostridium sp.]
METARILVAMGNEASAGKMRAVLVEGGFDVADQAKEGNECLRKIRLLKLDLAVLDYDLPLVNGFEVAKIAVEDKLCDVILLVSNEKKNSIESIKASYDFTILAKPLNRDSLINTVDIIVKSRRKIMKLEKEIVELRMTLDARKDIEKAKGLLMKNLNLTEEQAFRRIQKQSMDRAISMKEIAKAIILAYDI